MMPVHKITTRTIGFEMKLTLKINRFITKYSTNLQFWNICLQRP